jgi:dipeptidyl-peptidase-4
MSFNVISYWLILAFALVGAACTPPACPPIPTSAPLPATRVSYNPDVDLDIARLFTEPPAAGRVPDSPTWSPDSWYLAYIHLSVRAEGPPVRELWIVEMNTRQERPLVSDSEISVSDFDWCGSDRITYRSNGDLFIVDLRGKVTQMTDTDAVESSARSAPDCSKIAFVRDHDLFVLDVASGKERPVTRGGTRLRGFGEVNWLYGEEFGTRDGFGWSPDSKRLWVYATETAPETLRYSGARVGGGGPTQAYPKPGQANPKVYIGVADVSERKKPTVAWLDLGDEDVYLPQVTWHPDSERLAITRLDRLQTVLTLQVCSVRSRSCKPLLEERDPRWVNLLGGPKFDSKGETFLWLSERSGFAHIYRFGMDGGFRKQLTRGDWTVVSIDSVDEKNNTVYFTANAKQPFSYDTYALAEVEDAELVALSKDPGVHDSVFAPDGKHYVDTHSALDRPPRTDICKTTGGIEAVVARADLVEYKAPKVANDIFPIETEDGLSLMALMTRPLVLDQKRRYPVLIYVYGGPGMQVVKNAFRPSFQPWRNLMASRGLIVFSVDGRGSIGRGHEFEAAIHRRLGELELRDQLAGVDYLKNLPFVDPNRIGIFGWSYGGTMVLNALSRTKEVFGAGIAVAPVTDWRAYDSAYTERYMQRPRDNRGGYEDMSILPRVGQIEAPLLLIHGMADNNVHFSNSSNLMEALIDSGKYFETMFYHQEGHFISKPDNRADLFTRITRFIEEHL